MKCLMIETKDNKRFLTYQKNYKYLLEYIKTFGAKVFIVKTEKNQKILDLNRLVPALCDKNYQSKNLDFEILENKLENKKINIKRK